MEEHAQFDNPLMAQMAKRLEEEQARKLKEQQEIARQQQLDAFDQRIADLAAMIEKNEQLADDAHNRRAARGSPAAPCGAPPPGLPAWRQRRCPDGGPLHG